MFKKILEQLKLWFFKQRCIFCNKKIKYTGERDMVIIRGEGRIGVAVVPLTRHYSLCEDCKALVLRALEDKGSDGVILN